MDITEVTQIISNVGFPIGMCLLVFYYMAKETEHLRNTLEENTKVLSELTTLIKNVYGKER